MDEFAALGSNAVQKLRLAVEQENEGQRSELKRREAAVQQREEAVDRRERELKQRELKDPSAGDFGAMLLTHAPSPTRSRATTMPFMTSPSLVINSSDLSMLSPCPRSPVSQTPAPTSPQILTAPVGSTSSLKAMFEQKAAAATPVRLPAPGCHTIRIRTERRSTPTEGIANRPEADATVLVPPSHSVAQQAQELSTVAQMIAQSSPRLAPRPATNQEAQSSPQLPRPAMSQEISTVAQTLAQSSPRLAQLGQPAARRSLAELLKQDEEQKTAM